MHRLVLSTLFSALATLDWAAAAEVTLPPGAPLTTEAVAALVRAGLAARGMDGELSVEVRQPAAAVANEATAAMRVELAELRYDRRTGRYQARLEAVLPSGESASIPT